MKLRDIGITGFTLHDRETGCEMDAEWLPGEEQYKRLMIDDIEGFAFGAKGQLYLLDECGAWEDVDADKYDVRWEFDGLMITKLPNREGFFVQNYGCDLLDIANMCLALQKIVLMNLSDEELKDFRGKFGRVQIGSRQQHDKEGNKDNERNS